MGIFMAGEAIQIVLSMGGAMTSGACRHNLSPVLTRLIGVKLLVTIGAIEPMFTPLLFDGSKHTEMAAPTLRCAQGLKIEIIH